MVSGEPVKGKLPARRAALPKPEGNGILPLETPSKGLVMLSAAELWQAYNAGLVSVPAVGLELDLSRAGMSAAALERLAPRLRAALAAMAELERGALANADEKRMVGHYWLRRPELAPQGLGAGIRDTNAAIEKFAAEILAGGKFKHLLLIGIGGSMLGPQFLAEALRDPAGPGLKPAYLDNTDPEGMARVLGGLAGELDRTLVAVASKSGGTPETRNGMLEAQAAFAAAGVPFAAQAVAITGADSKLDQLAVRDGWRARFPMLDWVGGRTSVFSAVGLLPLALMGVPFRRFVAGGAAMDDATRAADLARNPAALLAAAWHVLGQGHGAKDMVVLPYNDRLGLFAKYLQQLVMESLGKQHDRSGKVVCQGLAVYGNKGSTDQHSYIQQLRDGLNNFFAVFVGARECPRPRVVEVEPGVTSDDFLHSFLLGTRKALFENGRASLALTLERVDAESVGGLVALFDRAVGLYAELVDVNAYHQPGVEAGKLAAATALEAFLAARGKLRAAGKPMTADQLAAAIGQPEAAETLYHLFRRQAAGVPARGIASVPGATPAATTFAWR